MMKTKATILTLMTALAFAGCGRDTSQQRMEAVEVRVKTSEVRIETTLSSTTPATSTTKKTTQTTSTTNTTTTTITTTKKITEKITQTASKTITATTTTVATTAIEPVMQPEPTVTESPSEHEPIVPEVTEPTEAPVPGTPGGLIYSGMRGTYYAPGSWNGYSATGGSGRSPLDCNGGGDGYAKGSIASRYLYNLLGYSSNGGRTAVWLSVAGYPDMDGIYYLDDCSGADVIDFFYNANGNCQFCYAGAVSVDIYSVD